MNFLRYIFDTARRGVRDSWSPRLSGVPADRRGVTAMVFALCATMMPGGVGLANEVGT